MKSIISISDSIFSKGELIKFINFSDGTIHLKTDSIKGPIDKVIHATIVDNSGIIALYQICEFLNNMSEDLSTYSLVLHYTPYARYDREMYSGDICSLKVFADMINSLNIGHIFLADPHSYKSANLINRSVIIQQRDIFSLPNGVEFDYIICPDEGAIKKSEAISKIVNKPIVYMQKNRNTSTGKIESITIDEQTTFSRSNISDINKSLNNKILLIIDDICDGGGTFSFASSCIRKSCNPKEINLYVSHLILPNKDVIQLDNIDNIYYYQDIGKLIGYRN